MNNLQLQLGLLNYDAVFIIGLSSGNTIFWDYRLDVRFRLKSTHHIDVEIRATHGSGIAYPLPYDHPITTD